MKPYIFSVLIAVCASLNLYAQEVSAPFTLHITGIEKLEGEIRVAMFDSKESYLDKDQPLYAVILPVNETTCTWTPGSLPAGTYAIAVYHDKNENGELDTNILGIPKEQYGFSNNARGRFGPASWEDAQFFISGEENSMEIEIK